MVKRHSELFNRRDRLRVSEARAITYDVEILRPIPERDGKADWEYARSGRCGISSTVLYDTGTGRYHVYDLHTISKLIEHLNEADVLIGFNNIEFDKRVVESVGKDTLWPPQVDILHEFRSNFSLKRGGWKLGMVCERTLGIGKTGDGESAPKLASQGRWGELFDYNLNDVHLTRLLFNHVQEHGWVVAPDNVRVPLEFFNVDRKVRA